MRRGKHQLQACQRIQRTRVMVVYQVKVESLSFAYNGIFSEKNSNL